MQKTFKKCVDNGKGGGETYRLRTRDSGLTAIEKTLRGKGTCANIGRIHGDNVQEMHRQREKMGTMTISCNEMRTEGTSAGHVPRAYTE